MYVACDNITIQGWHITSVRLFFVNNYMKITCKSRYKQIKAKLLLCDNQGMHNCNVGMDLWESIRLCHRPHGGNTSPDVGVSPS